VDVDHLHRACRHRLPPQPVHEPVDRHHLVRVEEKPCQERLLLASAQLDWSAALRYLEPPEDPELKREAHVQTLRAALCARATTELVQNRDGQFDVCGRVTLALPPKAEA
jgi:hypothetical protein